MTAINDVTDTIVLAIKEDDLARDTIDTNLFCQFKVIIATLIYFAWRESWRTVWLGVWLRLVEQTTVIERVVITSSKGT